MNLGQIPSRYPNGMCVVIQPWQAQEKHNRAYFNRTAIKSIAEKRKENGARFHAELSPPPPLAGPFPRPFTPKTKANRRFE